MYLFPYLDTLYFDICFVSSNNNVDKCRMHYIVSLVIYLNPKYFSFLDFPNAIVKKSKATCKNRCIQQLNRAQLLFI